MWIEWLIVGLIIGAVFGVSFGFALGGIARVAKNYDRDSDVLARLASQPKQPVPQ